MKNNLDKTDLEITQKLEQQEREKYTKRYNNLNYVDFINPNADKISSASTTTIKQETLEEAALIYASKPRKFGTRMTFIDGAKWQEQQTIEEVFEWLTTNNYLTDLKQTLIENFKNK
jgi:hypothetical protein